MIEEDYKLFRRVTNDTARSQVEGERAGMKKVFGGVLLSHTASRAVPSALKSLTSVFGMGTGVASSPSPPKNRVYANAINGAIWNVEFQFFIFMSVILWPSRTTD
jgi:hypothetical protein